MHVSDCDVGCVGGAFATFLAQFGHKAVIVSMTLRLRSKKGHRHRVRPDVLSCDASTNELRRQLESIPKDAEDWWDVSASLIREAAAHYSPVRNGNSKGVSQVASVLYRAGSREFVERDGTRFAIGEWSHQHMRLHTRH